METDRVHEATSIVAEATRRALDTLADAPDGAKLRAVVILMDVTTPDPEFPDDPAESYTNTIWKSAPADCSTTHAYGLCMMAAHGMVHNAVPVVADDE